MKRTLSKADRMHIARLAVQAFLTSPVELQKFPHVAVMGQVVLQLAEAKQFDATVFEAASCAAYAMDLLEVGDSTSSSGTIPA